MKRAKKPKLELLVDATGCPLTQTEIGIVVEKNVPIPKQKSGVVRYGFGLLKVGDSILFANEFRGVLATAASYYAKRNNIRLALRKVEGGIRVWRIA